MHKLLPVNLRVYGITALIALVMVMGSFVTGGPLKAFWPILYLSMGMVMGYGLKELKK